MEGLLLSFKDLIKYYCSEERTKNLVESNEIDSIEKLKEAFTNPKDFQNIGVLSQADLAQSYLKIRHLRSILKKYDLSSLRENND